MKSKNNMVMEMIDQLDEDDEMKSAMREIFKSEDKHSYSPSKTKVNNCRKFIEKVVK